MRQPRQRICRRLLEKTTTLHDLGEIAAIDASSFDRIAASSRYTRKTSYRIISLKTTLLIDCQTGAILDVHCSTNKPHDTQIGKQVFKRNVDRLDVVTAEKGYDVEYNRALLREHDVRPLIKHRELSPIRTVQNTHKTNSTTARAAGDWRGLVRLRTVGLRAVLSWTLSGRGLLRRVRLCYRGRGRGRRRYDSLPLQRRPGHR